MCRSKAAVKRPRRRSSPSAHGRATGYVGGQSARARRLHPPGCATRGVVVLFAKESGGNTMPITNADLLGKPDENQSIEEGV